MTTPSAERPIASIVWRLDEHDSRDHVRLYALDDGARLAGNAVLTVDGRPTSIDYVVEIDRHWRTLGEPLSRYVPHRLRLPERPGLRATVALC